ncbi:DUF2845 domain-containing protein [Gilvimarinus xylanilyticus]|uniref:DUF2845 domain-containing protein n=1 Tax=Gilvimarinus xylanilyticus TaxID=2944139 RepID=A0A9X2HXE6_9GAMM|nr:DUF2845 domain-containing protein [Gilvimarinus xylanilyticus]MCP8898794.1 DUF2845 domain-containing protein [Gilvimarinus xylanilyticus]
MKAALIFLVFTLASANLLAETVRIPIGQQGEHSQATPQTGDSKAQVLEKYGDPTQQSGPVGDPAIYRWDYQDFVVYFEDDRVIHAVIKFEPKVASDS